MLEKSSKTRTWVLPGPFFDEVQCCSLMPCAALSIADIILDASGADLAARDDGRDPPFCPCEIAGSCGACGFLNS